MFTNRILKLLAIVILVFGLAFAVQKAAAWASDPSREDKSFHTPQTSDYIPVDNSFHTPQTSDYRRVDKSFHTPQTSNYHVRS